MGKRALMVVALAACFSLAFCGTADAGVALLAGQFATNPDSTIATGVGDFTEGSVPAAYSTVVATMTKPLTSIPPLAITGTATSTVYRAADNTLAFEYSFVITTTTSPIREATIGGDWSLTAITDEGSDESGASTAVGAGWIDGDPAVLARSSAAAMAAPIATFSAITFPEGTEFATGQYSASFWFVTDAEDYLINGISLQDSGIVGGAPVFVPIPEPAAALLGLLGLGLVGCMKRRHR